MSLIAGIATWLVLPVLPAIIAIVAGHQARQEIQGSGGRVTGDVLAQIGLILGYLQVGLIVGGLILFLVIGGLALTLS